MTGSILISILIPVIVIINPFKILFYGNNSDPA